VPLCLRGGFRSVYIRATPWQRIFRQLALSSRHRRHIVLAQIATDAAPRPQPMPKHFPASRTLPLRQPPPTRQVHKNPTHQNRRISRLSQLQLPNHEAQKYKAKKQHHHQIPPRHITPPRPAIRRDILRAAFVRHPIGFSSFLHILVNPKMIGVVPSVAAFQAERGISI
jgi:hypothetical protein